MTLLRFGFILAGLRRGSPFSFFWKLLSQFDSHQFHTVEAGRTAVLRLRGRCGSLDVWNVYLDAHSSAARANSLKLIASIF